MTESGFICSHYTPPSLNLEEINTIMTALGYQHVDEFRLVPPNILALIKKLKTMLDLL